MHRSFCALIAVAVAVPLTAQTPPTVRQIPTRLEAHGQVRIDEFYWLNQRENPEVIHYLEAENAYTDSVMAHTKAFQDTLFEELKGRIRQNDASVPYRLDGYYYYSRFEEGKEYAIYCRKRGSLEATEEIVLDVNVLARGHAFFAVSGVQASPDGKMLAYAADSVGRRIYTIHFKDLTTGRDLPDALNQVTPNLAWANDNRTIFYTKQDPNTLRWYRQYRHTLGQDAARDVLVFEEKDETFSSFVFRTKSKQYIMLGSEQTLSAEYRYLDANRPQGQFTVFLPRQRNHEYELDHYGDHFYIRTNDHAQNFRLMRTPVAPSANARRGPAGWEEVIPNRRDVYLAGFEIFKDFLVLQERSAGLIQLRIRPWTGQGEHYVDFGEAAYSAGISTNPEFDTPLLRYGYSSLTTPSSTYDYDMRAHTKTLLKRDDVLGGFDPANYESRRFFARAADGTDVPVSLVYRKNLRRSGPQPLLLYGYGSYGSSTDASFSGPRLSLLDRGFIYAIAHVRGGQEMGRQWYDDGKLLHKMNTFTDFISCAEQLVRDGYTTPSQLFAQGGSAGGLLMGAITNLRPDLFAGVVAQVPFVDVVTTMLDSTIPLTTGEYDEWGNPHQRPYYDYMLSYSPYDNVRAVAYPHLLVTTGLHDSQVQYFEPAKWVARLRARKTDDHRLLLRTNMEAGHGGASGRFQRLRETAFVYAFLLDLANRAERPPTP